MGKSIFVSFDIDGTLVICEGSLKEHQEAFKEAVTELFGECDVPEKFLNHSIDGWMDKRILAAMITKAGFDANEDNLNLAMQKTEEIYVMKAKSSSKIPPGVERVLSVLSNIPNIEIGVASGNLPGIAWRKLELAGVAKYFTKRIGGFGVVIDRKDAIKASQRMAESIHSQSFDLYVHVGDTPNDVDAAHRANATAVAVRTGRVNYESFPEPSLVLNNLEEGFQAFMDLIINKE